MWKRVRLYKGLSIKDQSKPIGRYLEQICGFLIQEDQIDCYKMRCLFVSLFQAVGRSSEIGVWTSNSMYWDWDLSTLLCDWSEIKNSRTKVMTYHADKDSWRIDFYHALGAYFIVNELAYHMNEENFVFPMIASSSAASKVTEWAEKTET